MLFSSWQFILVFLPVAAAVFALIPARLRTARKWWLLAASLAFYGWWKIEYIPLLLFSIGFNYAAAEGIARSRQPGRSRWILHAGVAANLALLGYFKYTNFLLYNAGILSGHNFPHLDIVLPLAVSFFTFTQIGYLVDVSRDTKLHYGPLDYALFVVFFPHLIAGPIVRHWEVIPQYAEKDLRPDGTDWAAGLTLFLCGLCKKLLLADTVAVFANTVFDAAARGASLNWFDAWLGTLAFTVQLYFDFSGYSDMAIGLARLFGIKFPANFDSPYQAKSIAEFWQRWHMTLTRFLREYLYIPLGGNRCGAPRQVFNVMATFLLSGLWHGAGWTYIAWGGIHGAALVLAQKWRTWRPGFLWRADHWAAELASRASTFLLVVLAWVFFRAANLATAGRVLASMLGFHGLTISAKAIETGGAPLRWLAGAGVRVTPDSLGMADYNKPWHWTAALLLLAWLAPNTQQLLAACDPVTGFTPRPTRWRFPIGAPLGFILGALMFQVLRSRYFTPESPFLYFNF